MLSEKLQKCRDLVWFFDHFYQYSDDAGVWRTGHDRKAAIKLEVSEMCLTTAELEYVLADIGIEWEAHYQAACASHSNIAKQPLWYEGHGPMQKAMIRDLLGLS
jgi:hypothetical protein